MLCYNRVGTVAVGLHADREKSLFKLVSNKGDSGKVYPVSCVWVLTVVMNQLVIIPTLLPAPS